MINTTSRCKRLTISVVVPDEFDAELVAQAVRQMTGVPEVRTDSIKLNLDVDVDALSDDEIKQAFRYSGARLGSNCEYTVRETRKALEDRSNLVAYVEADTGELRVYNK